LTKRYTAELVLFAATFIWGGTFVIVKLGLEDVSPLLLTALRFSIAALLFFLLFSKHILAINRDVIHKGSILGLLLFIGFATQTIGLKYTTASKSAFITGMFVIFTPLFQFFLEKKSPQRSNLIGIVIVSVGLWLLTKPSGGGFGVGDGLTLSCAIVFGLYIVALDIISKQHDIIHLAFLQMISCAALSWISFGILENPLFKPTPNALWGLAYLTILATVATTYVQTRFQQDTTPTRAAIIFTIEPVWAAISAYLFLHEILGMAGLLGGGLIIAGILISELSGSRNELSHSLKES
jgi:drug/metabolite transporter (DMT)-like permease